MPQAGVREQHSICLWDTVTKIGGDKIVDAVQARRYDKQEVVISLCPYAAGEAVKVCSAGSKSYVPSLLDYEKYCGSQKFRKCPLYCRVEYGVRQNGAGISVR